jgi:hypothetical protein
MAYLKHIQLDELKGLMTDEKPDVGAYTLKVEIVDFILPDGPPFTATKVED